MRYVHRIVVADAIANPSGMTRRRPLLAQLLLVRGLGTFKAHQLIDRSGVRNPYTPLGALTTRQRISLCRYLDPENPEYRPVSEQAGLLPGAA